jgi:hypothetical protein
MQNADKGIDIKLDRAEETTAFMGGIDRQRHVEYQFWENDVKLNNRYTKNKDAFRNAALSAGSEFAVCKHVGVNWSPTIGEYNKPDAGPYQVRGTDGPDQTQWGELQFVDKDFASGRNQVFILVHWWQWYKGIYTLRGWCYGHEGMVPEFRRSPKDFKISVPGWFIPGKSLHSMKDLPPL